MYRDPGKIVKDARKKLRKNQSEFAIHIGKTQSLVSKYEGGGATPPGDVVIHCMNILGPELDSRSISIKELQDQISLLEGDAHAHIRQAINVLMRTLSTEAQL